MLKSAEVNMNPGERLTVHFMDLGILSRARKMVVRTLDPNRVQVKWYPIRRPMLRQLEKELTIMKHPSFQKMVFSEVLPKSVNKLVYVDVDVLVLSSLQALYATDLAGKSIGAVQDRAGTVDCPWAGIPNYAALGIPAKTPYFNAGIMLIDCARWRAGAVTQRVIQISRENRPHVRFAEQYGLNVLLREDWKELDPAWNCGDDQAPHPKLFHFLNRKPTALDYAGQKGALFYHYLDQTAWAGWRPKAGSHRLRFLREIIIKKLLVPLGF